MNKAILLVLVIAILGTGGACAESILTFGDASHNMSLQETVFMEGDTVYVSVFPDTIGLGAPRNYSVSSSDDAVGTTMNLSANGLAEWRGSFVVGSVTQQNVSIKADSATANVTVFADLDSNGANASKLLEIDNTAPAITPSVNSSDVANGQTVKISATVSDSNGVDNVSISVNGTSLSVTNSSGTYTATYTAGGVEGTYIANVTANDTIGNFGFSTTSFGVDNSAPTGAVVQPANESYVSSQSPMICANITDPNDVDVSSIAMDVFDGNTHFPLETTTAITDGYKACIDIAPQTENDGTHLDVYVNATDSLSASNKLVNFYWWFKVDLNPPSITLHAPGNGSVNPAHVNITVTDSSSGEMNCSYFLNSTTEYYIGWVANNTFNSTNLTTPADGNYSLTVSCEDMAGHSSTTGPSSITVDTTPPVIGVAVNDTYLIVGEAALVTATVADLLGVDNVSISVGGVPMSTTGGGGTYTAVFTPGALPDGIYNVNVTANDTLGNIAFNDTMNITVDATAPVITVYEPTGVYNDSEAVNFNITVLEKGNLYVDANFSNQTEVTCEWSVDSPGWGTLDGLFGTFTHKENGSHFVAFNCSDAAGNTAQFNATYDVNDSTPPVMNLISPENLNYTSTSVLLEFNVTEHANCSYSVDNGAASDVVIGYGNMYPAYTDYYWNTTLTLSNASHNISVNCTDTGNNTVSAQQNFTVQIIFPDGDGDGYDNQTDCNDANAAVNPGATEACNGIDDDCDGTIDEGCGGGGTPPGPGGSGPDGGSFTPNNEDPPEAVPEDDPIELPTPTPIPVATATPEPTPEPTPTPTPEPTATPTPTPASSPITGLLFSNGSLLWGLAALMALATAWSLWAMSKERAKRKWYEN
ncbi:Ig-like domain-containing protein [archaeon]